VVAITASIAAHRRTVTDLPLTFGVAQGATTVWSRAPPGRIVGD
jgi:hypothetical protein